MPIQNETGNVDGESASPQDGAIVDALLAELKDDQGGTKQAALRRALEIDDASGVEPPDGSNGADVTRTSDDVRIERLQATVESLAAYTDALEAFLDENGTAETVLADLQEGLDETRTELEALSATVDELEAADADHADRLATTESRCDSIEDAVKTLAGQLADLENATEAAVKTLDEQFGSLEGRVETLERRLEMVADRADDTASTVNSRTRQLEVALEDLELAFDEQLSALEADLEAEIDDLREEIDDASAADEFQAELDRLESRVDERLEDLEADVSSDIVEVEKTLVYTTNDLEDEIRSLAADINDLRAAQTSSQTPSTDSDDGSDPDREQ